LNANAGINYLLTGGATVVFLQGSFRYNLTNLVTDPDFKELLYGFGFEVGARRSIAADY